MRYVAYDILVSPENVQQNRIPTFKIFFIRKTLIKPYRTVNIVVNSVRLLNILAYFKQKREFGTHASLKLARAPKRHLVKFLDRSVLYCLSGRHVYYVVSFCLYLPRVFPRWIDLACLFGLTSDVRSYTFDGSNKWPAMILKLQ